MIIFLVGYAGSGKSSLGKRLSRRLGVRYVDTSIPTTGVKAVDRFYDSQLLFTLGVSF